MQIELIKEESFTVRAGLKAIQGLRIAGEWEGMLKLQDIAGNALILNDGQIVKGSPDLLAQLSSIPAGFVQVPETTLPGGLVVPAFHVAQHISSKDADGKLSFDPSLMPWVNIALWASQKVAEAAGYKLITETQWLAIAWNLSQQDCNWTGGKVGEGDLFQGIRFGGGARPGDYKPENENERRWMALSNGVRLCDFNGNVFQWVIDNVQGDERGLIAKAFEAISPSLTVAPFASLKKGMGWRPDPGAKWSSYALIRGGCWNSDDRAGVFRLDHGSPGDEYGIVGFRCTF